MSSKHKERSYYYPTGWSAWEWNEEHQCDTRYRQVSEGRWEWEYHNTAVVGQQAYSQPVETVRYPTEDYLPADPSQHHEQDNGLSDITQRLAGATISSAYGEGQQYTEGGQYQQYAEYNKTDFCESKGVEFDCPKCSKTFSRKADLDRHHKTEHLKDGIRPYECRRPGCPGNVKSWINIRGYRQHEKHWHGPWSCSAPGCSRGYPFGFSSEADLEIHQVEHSGDSQPDKSRDERYRGKGKGAPYKGKGRSYQWADTSYGNQSYVPEDYSKAEGTQQPAQDISPQEGNSRSAASNVPGYYSTTNAGYQQQSSYASYSTAPLPDAPLMKRNIEIENTKQSFEQLDKSYKVHRSTEFQFGRVFKVLWSEPVGSGGTEITTAKGPYGERYFAKVRRFLIVSAIHRGHSICLPIMTYSMQGVLKAGVHPEDHAVVYSSRRDGRYLLEREEGLMPKSPIRIEMNSPREKLDLLSRLNYAKVYTVEHNVKVFFIGRVAKECEHALIVAYNKAHPPLGPGPVPYEPDEDSFELLGTAKEDGPQYTLGAIPTSTATSYISSQSYPYAGSSDVSTDAHAYTAPPTSSQTVQAAECSAYDPTYDDGYD